MENETGTATTNPTTEATVDTTPATLLTPASTETGTQQQTQTTETPAATATETTATAAAKTETAKTTNAPEKYEFTAPEGTEYDSGILEAFTGAAREADLTQDAAQKLLEKMAPALAARQADQVQAIHTEWTEASKADKEFGGEKLKENLGVARKALDNFGTPELRALLDTTGLGNHPEVLRFMFRAGKAISEDKFVGGSAASNSTLNPTAVLYDKTAKG